MTPNPTPAATSLTDAIDCTKGDALFKAIELAKALEADRAALLQAIKDMRRHQTPMGGSFTQWYDEIREIGAKALNASNERLPQP